MLDGTQQEGVEVVGRAQVMVLTEREQGGVEGGREMRNSSSLHSDTIVGSAHAVHVASIAIYPKSCAAKARLYNCHGSQQIPQPH